MANLDLNELLNNSIANVSNNKDKEPLQQEGDLNVDLENVDGEAGNQVASGALNLDLESVQDQIDLNLDTKIFEDIKGAIGAGVATYAVLEAREEARTQE